MIDNTAFFSVMAPYMPLRPFPGLEERGKRRILVTRKFQPSFPPYFFFHRKIFRPENGGKAA